MSRRFSPAVIALLMIVIAAACGGEEEPTRRASPTPTASETAEASPTPSESPSPPAPASPSPAPSRAPAPAPPPRPAPAPAPAGPQPVTGAAAPGQYIFDEAGAIGTQGCLLANQAPPTPTRLNVGGPTGNRQVIERDQTGSGSVGSVSRIELEYREDGAYLVSLHQEQRVNAQTLIFDFPANPPQRLIPAFPKVGDTGNLALTSGQVNLSGFSAVEAVDEPVTLGQGAALRTIRIRTISTITGVSPQGSLNLNVTRTSWYSVDKHLEVKDVTDTTGTVGLCRVNSHVESLARSV